jgi:hypothetical protein
MSKPSRRPGRKEIKERAKKNGYNTSCAKSSVKPG